MKSSKLFLFSAIFISATLLLSGCGADNWEASMKTTDVEKTEVAASNAQYKQFTQAEYDALIGKSPFVLYFHADWCSTCKRLAANLKEDIGEFPEGTIVLEADFDKELQLRKEYNVVNQTTLLVFNAKGAVVKTLNVPSKIDLMDAVKASMMAVEKVAEVEAETAAEDETAEVEAETATKDEAGTKTELEEASENEVEAASTDALDEAEYLSFSQAKYAELDGKKPYAIYFHANWCHVCRNLESKIKLSLNSLPKGTKILQADFDTELKLRKKYGITVQTVIVVLDKDGNVVDKLMNPSISKLTASLKSSIEA